jgi:transposase InsO family protein
MVRYVDGHRDRFGVEPICKVLPIAPSTYYEQKARERDPDRRPARLKRDEALKPEIERVFVENFCVYGARKIWKQLNRESVPIARCTTERLAAELGIRGAVRGKAWKTTIPEADADRPRDLVQRSFTAKAPNRLWVADITYGVPSLGRRLEDVPEHEHVWNAKDQERRKNDPMPARCYG